MDYSVSNVISVAGEPGGVHQALGNSAAGVVFTVEDEVKTPASSITFAIDLQIIGGVHTVVCGLAHA